MPERFRGELLTMGRYTNLASFTLWRNLACRAVDAHGDVNVNEPPRAMCGDVQSVSTLLVCQVIRDQMQALSGSTSSSYGALGQMPLPVDSIAFL